MLSNVLTKIKDQEFVQGIVLAVVADMVTILLALIVAYYILIFSY